MLKTDVKKKIVFIVILIGLFFTFLGKSTLAADNTFDYQQDTVTVMIKEKNTTTTEQKSNTSETKVENSRFSTLGENLEFSLPKIGIFLLLAVFIIGIFMNTKRRKFNEKHN